MKHNDLKNNIPSINMVKFTITADGKKEIKYVYNTLNNFVFENKLIPMPKSLEDRMLLRTRYRLANDYCDLISIKQTVESDTCKHFTVTFNNLLNIYKLEKLSDDAGGIAQHEYEKLSNRYCNRDMILDRINCFLDFIKYLQEDYLYKNAKLKQIGLVSNFHLPNDMDPTILSFLEVFKNKRDDFSFKQHKLNTEYTVYSKVPQKFYAYVKYSKSIEKEHDEYSPFFSLIKDDKYLNEVIEESGKLSADDEIKIIDNYFKTNYPHHKIETKLDATKRIVLEIDSDSILKYGFPTKEELKFFPDYGNKVNHASIELERRDKSMKKKYTLDDLGIRFKQRASFKIFIKNFETRDKNLVEEYDGKDKITFRLGDRLDDISNVILRYVNDFYIMYDKDYEFETFDKKLSGNKLFKEIDKSSIETIQMGERVADFLDYFIGKKEEEN